MQEKFINNFANYLKELKLVFAFPNEHKPFTLEKALHRQRRYLHGYEERECRYIPKVHNRGFYSKKRKTDGMLMKKTAHSGCNFTTFGTESNPRAAVKTHSI
jgi:hypothetical protein